MERLKDIEPRYDEFDLIELPAAIPEIGVEAGHPGVILEKHGDYLIVDVSDEAGRTLDLVDVEIGAVGLEVIGRWHLTSQAAKLRG